MSLHSSYDNPQPDYPKKCPVCGSNVTVYHHTLTYSRDNWIDDSEWIWIYTGRCWNGHLVPPIDNTPINLQSMVDKLRRIKP